MTFLHIKNNPKVENDSFWLLVVMKDLNSCEIFGMICDIRSFGKIFLNQLKSFAKMIFRIKILKINSGKK